MLIPVNTTAAIKLSLRSHFQTRAIVSESSFLEDPVSFGQRKHISLTLRVFEILFKDALPPQRPHA